MKGVTMVALRGTNVRSLIVWVMLCGGLVIKHDTTVAQARGGIEGKYIATAEAMQRLRRAGHRGFTVGEAHVIELRGDGSCYFASLLRYDGLDAVDSFAQTSDCKWRLEVTPTATKERSERLILDIETMTGRERSFAQVDYYVDRREAETRLWTFVGDPDLNERIEFARSR